MAGFVAFWIICAFIGLAIGSSKGQAAAGFLLGLLLGPVGLLIALIMKPSIQVQAQRAEAVDFERARIREQQVGTQWQPARRRSSSSWDDVDRRNRR